MLEKMTSMKPHRNKMSKLARREAIDGYIGILPWLIGFLAFTAIPLFTVFYLSFTYWDILTPIKWAGFENFKHILTDKQVLSSLWNTMRYTVFVVPITTALGLLTAVLLNQKMKGILLFRVIFYLPSVLPGVAVALLWVWILNPDYGVINTFLGYVGIKGPMWLSDPNWAMPGIILRACWGVGGGMILFLAALEGVPQNYYEAATIDGANAIQSFFKITLPMISPTIFYFVITGTIASLQEYVLFRVMTNGGPVGSTKTFVFYLYETAFQRYSVGYASALAWVIFAICLILTAALFKFSSWVYYEGGEVK
ncbi:MAG: carbohydrate ABC transporter permease [Ruminiclostridium sp.]